MSWNPFNDTYGRGNKTDTAYFPADFRDQIEQYKDETRERTEYKESGYIRPDYSVLQGPRLDYYFWWRAQVDDGNLPQVDAGYAWLRAVELINSKDDPKEVMRRIVNFAKVCSKSMRLAPFVCSLPLDYALVHNLSLGSVPRERPFPKSQVLLTWDLTRHPIRMPDTDLLLDSVFYRWYDVLDTDESTMADIVCMSLAGIDEFTRSSTGKGVVRSTGCEWEMKDIFPYSGYADYSGAKHLSMPSVPLREGPFHDLLEAIVKQAVALMREDGVRGPQVPKTFPKAYRRIVAAAVDAAVNDDAWDARVFRNPSPPEGDIWRDDDLERPEDDEEPHVALRPIPNMEIGTPPMTTREIDSNWDLESDVLPPYVSSGRNKTSYRFMDEQQKAFYIGWRSQARKGRYTDTDRGYLWLYCVELINHDYVPDNIQDELERAVDAFYDAFPPPRFLFRAAVDHALLHGMDTPPVPDADCSPALAYTKLRSDPIGRISPDVARALADYPALSLEKYVRGYERLYSDVFTAAYRATDVYCYEKFHRRLYAMAFDAKYKSQVRLYDELWYPKRLTVDLTYLRIAGSVRLQGILDGTLKVCLRSVGKRIGRTHPRVPDMDPDMVDAIEEAISGVFGRIEKEDALAKALRDASRIKIDRAAVESAESDLRVVTGLMATEEEEEPEESPFEASTGTVGDGWEALESALDAVEMDYLRYGNDALKGTGRRPQAVEESINNKAMDAVGDAIMEDGTVFEDYEEDVRRMLG